MKKIAVLPGDGIGLEITVEAVKVLKATARKFGLQLDLKEGLIGGAAYDACGSPLPAETVALCQASDAVLMGAVGGPKWDKLSPELRPERGALLPLRKLLGLYANLRPVRVFETLVDASTLKADLVTGLDLLVVRELTGGLYFGEKKREPIPGGFRVVDTLEYTSAEIERVTHLAFAMALRRRGKLTSVDKANVLESSILWREIVEKIAPEYPGVTLEHMLVDNCAMQLVRDPGQFDVILTENMFGDILSDEASILTGSLGMLPSASLGGHVGLYEPCHGSAPTIAGQDTANPIATIMSAALLLRYSLEFEEAAAVIEKAVAVVLNDGYRTYDIMQPGARLVGTQAMGGLIAAAVESL